MKKSISKFFSVLFLLCIVCDSSAYAAAHLSTCTPPGTGGSSGNGSGLDGSDCDAGYLCDRSMKVCISSFEVPCRAKGCSVGTICVDLSGDRVSGVTIGVCQVDGGSSTEDNAISDILCNLYKFITGKTGRIVIGIIFVGAGGTFLLGKMQLGTVIAIALGCGCIFGASAIVNVFVGRGFAC
ncbi:MAG: TrbC/VirB2 family protein [Alphaproteobacteria bacterium]|nr:TrbC/VirB2 family protein [Rickettsiales bacterium]